VVIPTLTLKNYKAEEHKERRDQATSSGKIAGCIIKAGHEEEPEMHH
jgi:hypothetical protein